MAAMLFVALVALYLATFLGCAMRWRAREGFWAPAVIFGISAFYYYLAVPVELFLRGQDVFAITPGTFVVTAEARVTIAWCALLALAGFALGHQASGLGRAITQADAPAPRGLPNSLRLIAVGAVALFVLLYRTKLFEKLAYTDANELRYTDPVFCYLTRLTLLVGCLAAGIVLHRRGWRKAPALVIVALAVAWGLHTSDKNPLLKAALAVSAGWVGSRNSGSLRHLALYCGAAVLAVGGLPLFSAYRAGGPLDVRAAVTDFSVLDTDASGPMISLVVAIEEETERFYGRSYLFSLVAWVPRLLWPDRPNDLAHEFALDQIPDWQPGSGLGYSLLAEAYLNFGYAGAFAQYFVLAFCLGRFWRLLYNLLARSGATAYWRAMLAVTYYEILILMHRAPSSGILQSCIFELLIPVGAFCVLDARRRSRRAAYAGPVVQMGDRKLRSTSHGSNPGYRTDARPLGA
jgi:hypothetical protein